MHNDLTVLRSLISDLSETSIKICPIGSAKLIYGDTWSISYECLSRASIQRRFMLNNNAPHLAFEGYQRYATMYLTE